MATLTLIKIDYKSSNSFNKLWDYLKSEYETIPGFNVVFSEINDPDLKKYYKKFYNIKKDQAIIGKSTISNTTIIKQSGLDKEGLVRFIQLLIGKYTTYDPTE